MKFKALIMKYKSRIRAYLALVLYLITSLFYPRIHARNAGKTRVIVFHHIDKPNTFRQILLRLNNSYNIISFNDFISGHRSNNKINIIIALDDGYKSWMENGLPIFIELGISPLLFINSDFVGQNKMESDDYCRTHINTWPEQGLSWEDVKSLREMGAEIGGHGHRHPDLTGHQSYDEKLALVLSDRQLLTEQLGCFPKIFAYPYGRYDDSSIRLVEECGYQYGFTSDSGFMNESQLPYRIKRTNVGMRSPAIVCAYVEGWGERITLIMKWLKSLAR